MNVIGKRFKYYEDGVTDNNVYYIKKHPNDLDKCLICWKDFKGIENNSWYYKSTVIDAFKTGYYKIINEGYEIY
jgi:hypothetical protein